MQSQFCSVYRSDKDVATVRADHSYAMNIPLEKKERSLYDLLSNIGAEYTQELELKKISTDSALREKQNLAEYNGRTEHNYVRRDPDLTPKRRRYERTIHEMEHNYGRPHPGLFDNNAITETSGRSDGNNRCAGRTISEIWEGCPWSGTCPWTICDGGESCSVQVCRVADARTSFFSC